MAVQATEPTQQPLADMRWLSHFIGKHRRPALYSLVSGVIGGITLALEPYLIGIIIDNILEEGVNMRDIGGGIALLVGLAAITVIMFFIQRHYAGVVAYAVHYDVRKTIFDHMVDLDNDFYKQYSTGDLISRMFSDLNWIWRLLALAFTRGGNAISGAIIAFGLLALVDLRLTLVVFIVLIISTVIQIRAGLGLIPVMERVQDQQGHMTELVQDAVTGIQTIKTFGREDDASRAFYQENAEFRDRWLRFKRLNEPVGLLPQMVIYLTQGVVVLYGGLLVINDPAFTIGNFTQFLLYLGLIGRVLLMLGTTYQRYMQTKGALQRITPLLREATITDGDAGSMGEIRGDITFENVGLQEDGQWLLRHINLHIPGGSVVALVGPTGGGKTLLVNLLSRVSDVDEGSVKIDGQDVRRFLLTDLRNAIAYVPQQTFLFSQPLHENVRMGRSEITDEELERAIHISRVSNDLDQMPKGLDTLVGEKGVMLSGGQKQRVAIARAIVRNPAILILDDALSSVDTQTAAEILSDMRQVLTTRTSILIAHRIATVKDADFILVMEGGEIVEQGTHDDLIARQGLYASMVAREALQEEEELD